MTQALLSQPTEVTNERERCDIRDRESRELECPTSSGPLITDARSKVAGENSTMQAPRSRAEKIQEGLERTISQEAKERIEKILDDVHQLSDVEKLLLYLKLPTGNALGYCKDGSSSALQSSNRLEQIQAVTWIKSHLEEHVETSMPKQEVYDDYKLYCERHGYKFLSQGDFGKVMKCVFPNVKPRRLGQRGQSKHCYGGLRKKVQVQPPSLPDVTVAEENEEESDNVFDEALTASCELVCEWARKLLSQDFPGIRDLAEHLVGQSYVNSRSMAAFTVLAAAQKAGIPKTSSSTVPAAANRHRETQLQLQRKLHERELLRREKRKLEQTPGQGNADSSGSPSDGHAEEHAGKSLKADKQVKVQTPITPQKLILPKTLSTTQSTVTTTAAPQQAVVNMSVPVQPSTPAQSILVFSPTPPQLGQPGQALPQPLFILSPVQQRALTQTHNSVAASRVQTGGVPKQNHPLPPQQNKGNSGAIPAQAQPTIMPIQPVLVNTLPDGQPVQQKGVNLVQLPVLGPLLPTSISAADKTQAVEQVKSEDSGTTQSQTHSISAREQDTQRVEKVSQGIDKGISESRTLVPVSAGNDVVIDVVVGGQKKPGEGTTDRHNLGTAVNLVQTLSSDLAPDKLKVEVLKETKDSIRLGVTGGATPAVTNKPGQTASTDGGAGAPTGQANRTNTPIVTNLLDKDQTQNSDGASQQQQPQPQKVRQAPCSKTVSSLLREQRGFGPLVENKASYTNDRRPVAALLRECRQRQAHIIQGQQATVIATTLSPQGLHTPVGTPTLSPNTLMIQTLTMSKPGTTSVAAIGSSNTVTTASPLRAQPVVTAALLVKPTEPNKVQEKIQPATSNKSPNVGNRKFSTGTMKIRDMTSTTLANRRVSFSGATSTREIPRENGKVPQGVTDNLKKSLSAPGRGPQFTEIPVQPSVVTSAVTTNMSGNCHANEKGRAPQGITDNSLKRSLSAPDGGPQLTKKTILSNIVASRSAVTPDFSRTSQANEFAVGQNKTGMTNLKYLISKSTAVNGVEPPATGIANNLNSGMVSPGVKSEKPSEMNISNLEKDALLDYLGDEPAPDLADITPSITQIVNSQDVETLTDSNQGINVVRNTELSLGGSTEGTSTKSQIQVQSRPGSAMGSHPGQHASAGLTQSTMDCVMSKATLKDLLSMKISQTPKSVKDFLSPPTVQRVSHANLLLQAASAGQLGATQSNTTATGSFSGQTNAQEVYTSQSQLLHQLRGDVLLSQAAKAIVSQSQGNQQVSQGKGYATASFCSDKSAFAGIYATMNALGNNLAPASSHQAQLTMTSLAQTVSSAPPMLVQQQQPVVQQNAGMMFSPQGMAASHHSSAASTPTHMMSPPPILDRNEGTESSNSFMPIQTTQQGTSMDINLVRPQVTMATSLPQLGNLETQCVPLPNSSSGNFVPYSASVAVLQDRMVLSLPQNENKNPPSYGQALKQKILQNIQVPDQQTVVDKGSGQFAPASSIKPIKRGQKGQRGGRKRARHRSAQSAIGRPQPAAGTYPGLPVNNNPLAHLQQQPHQQQTSHGDLKPMSVSVPMSDSQMSLGANNPESPFSPEILDIFNSGTQPTLNSTGQFRSHSVPVQSDFFNTGSDNQDLFQSASAMIDHRRETPDYFDQVPGMEISSLLQDKMQEESLASNRGTHMSGNDGFGARRNITEFLETKQGQGQTGLMHNNADMGFDFDDQASSLMNFTRRGDMTLTSATLCDRRSSLLKLTSFNNNNPVPTPPASQNPTPDFSTELQSLASQSQLGLSSMGRQSAMACTPSLDTPSSLDTISTQDSRESLNESLFQSMCEGPGDIGQDMGSGQSLDMVSNNDFGFAQWEMPQMVHD